MTHLRFRSALRASLIAFLPFFLFSLALAQGAKVTAPATPIADADDDHEQERAEWFMRGRVIPGKSAAELRHRAYQAKMQARADRLARAQATHAKPASSGTWTPLGPVPLASDATGDGFQDYRQVSGRSTAVTIDPADPTGNTVYIGGAQGGVWKSTNAATATANNVTWSAVTDEQATLSIGSIAIQPGNSDPNKSVVLVGTGEADNSADSYFGLGFLRSTDGGNTWSLISTANNGTLSFSGLGATRMAFSTASGHTSTVVAAMAATSEGTIVDALTSNTVRGLYTSTDAGQTWTFSAPFSGSSEITSATSVVYNAVAGLFFAAERYHGFYSSPDGLTWTRLATQPGALNTASCPLAFSSSCPIYRAEITVVPGRNEMYVWYISLSSSGQPVDQGIWQSENGGSSWTQISDTGITSCGDSGGCGVSQGTYNLELLAVPNGSSATDVYAGTINIYKCSINSSNSTCASSPFMNLTHVYGCNPIGALAHVHPDQHALASTVLSSGADLMYFSNDGGIYRALDGFSGLTTGSCSGTNQFDDLNQNLGSMTQFVSFSQSATDQNTILGGTQDNGSPATTTATTSSSWSNVLGGDGGYNAIDSATNEWYASNPDVGGGSLGIDRCASGLSCDDSKFFTVVSSSTVGGDDGAFYFPYILDPQSTTTLLVGTCRVWQGPRAGGAYSVLSLNFDTLGTGVCNGGEVNLVRALAAGGPTNASGSQVIYAATDGFGPNSLTTPAGGNVWVTTNAKAVSGTTSTFTQTTQNGPGGSNINPNQFPISSVAIDASDTTGNTAYVTVTGFTGGTGLVWQTTNAGASWTDFTGTGANALPNDPVNAVVVDNIAHIVYVGTDVGVFQSPTSSAAWTEVGPNPASQQSGFLPNVAVTALAIFNSGGQEMLRASTYGRGVWQFSLTAGSPDFQIAVSNSPLTAFQGTTATFSGTLTAQNGYNNSVTLSCVAGANNPPSPCTPNPATLTPTSGGAAFSVAADTGTPNAYNFNVQGVGSDAGSTTHATSVTLNVVNFGLTTASPTTVITNPGTTSPSVGFSATAQGPFAQNVTLTCSFAPSIANAGCNFNTGPVVSPTSSNPVPVLVTVTVPAGTALGNYTVTVQATTPGAPTPLPTSSFTLSVALIPAYTLSGPATLSAPPTGQVMANLNFTSLNSYSGQVNAACDATALPGAICTISPVNPITIGSGAVVPATATINIPTNAAPGAYNINITSEDLTGLLGSNLPIVLTVFQDFTLSPPTPSTQTISAGQTATYNFSVGPEGSSFTDAVNLTCSGAPTISLCTFTPNSVTPGSNATNVTLTISTTASSASISRHRSGFFYALWLALPGIVLLGTRRRRKKFALPASLLGLVFLLLVLCSCGGGGSNGGGTGPQQQGTQPGTYTITVTGTSGSLSHQSASVTLTVN